MEKFNGIEYVKKNIKKLKNLSIEELALFWYDIDRSGVDLNLFVSDMKKLLGDERKEELENFVNSNKVISIHNFKFDNFSSDIKKYLLTDRKYKEVFMRGIITEIFNAKNKDFIYNDFYKEENNTQKIISAIYSNDHKDDRINCLKEGLNALPLDIVDKNDILDYYLKNNYFGPINFSFLNLDNFDPKLVKKVKNKIKIIENNYKLKDSLDDIKDFVRDNAPLTITCVVLALGLTGIVCGTLERQHFRQADVSYESSIELAESNVDLTDGYYEENNFDKIKLNDVFLVYNIDNHYSCYRKLVGYDQQYISHVFSTQAVLDRVEIYEYYDLQTGEKVCQTGDEGYFYEPIINYIDFSDIKDLDYEVTAEQLNQMIEQSDMMEGNNKLSNRFNFR